jgi:hypothetical protein
MGQKSALRSGFAARRVERSDGRLLSVEGAKMSVARGEEFGRRLPLSKIEKNGSPSTNRTILKKHRTIIGRFAWVSDRSPGPGVF